MLDRHGFAIVLVCAMIASMGGVFAFQQAWTSNTGQPEKMTADGQNILVTTASSVKEVDPTGAAI